MELLLYAYLYLAIICNCRTCYAAKQSEEFNITTEPSSSVIKTQYLLQSSRQLLPSRGQLSRAEVMNGIIQTIQLTKILPSAMISTAELLATTEIRYMKVLITSSADVKTQHFLENISATRNLQQFDDYRLSKKASMIVGVWFIPGIIILFLFCRYIPGWCANKLNTG